ncbi:BLUF domain-containing protein [Nocardioides sp. 616]|uniref:BLUF domain-containing protein n=1 Tax=Nocardioides sp. 616 TaxID=2268090 RepID=UPI000CE3A59B|nr:BLUF domain-containing protein [Nocardioides sp. 616]
MISLTYISTATSSYGESELTDLLLTTREKNQATNLTGVLLYADGHFIQTLEGPEDAVEETYGRIQRDRRHRNLDVALRDGIEERTFPDWSMGFKSISPEQAAELPGFNDYLAGRTISPESRVELGRAGIFHRVFRRTMG